MPLSYVVLGGIAAFYPLIMGNGQVLAQWLFSGGVSAYLPLILVVKGLMVCLLLWAGSYGDANPFLYLRCRIGFPIDKLSWDFWLITQSYSRNVTWCNRIFRNNFRCSSNWDSLSSRFYWSRRELVAVPLILASLLSRIIKNRWKKKQWIFILSYTKRSKFQEPI